MRTALKMLDKSISLTTPMFHLPGGLVIDVWSCHFSGPWPALPATSKTKFLTYMKEFMCQRTYLSSPQNIKLLVFIIRLLIQDQKYSVWGGQGRRGIQSQNDLIRKTDSWDHKYSDWERSCPLSDLGLQADFLLLDPIQGSHIYLHNVISPGFYLWAWASMWFLNGLLPPDKIRRHL